MEERFNKLLKRSLVFIGTVLQCYFNSIATPLKHI